VRFIEDPALLAPVGGVGAFLRFKLCAAGTSSIPITYKIAGRNRPNERRHEGSRPAERDVQPRALERARKRKKERRGTVTAAFNF